MDRFSYRRLQCFDIDFQMNFIFQCKTLLPSLMQLLCVFSSDLILFSDDNIELSTDQEPIMIPKKPNSSLKCFM